MTVLCEHFLITWEEPAQEALALQSQRQAVAARQVGGGGFRTQGHPARGGGRLPPLHSALPLAPRARTQQSPPCQSAVTSRQRAEAETQDVEPRGVPILPPGTPTHSPGPHCGLGTLNLNTCMLVTLPEGPRSPAGRADLIGGPGRAELWCSGHASLPLVYT